MVNGFFFVMEIQVIVVIFNYCFGVFGFVYFILFFFGNYGIQDQILVVKWVRRNIVFFGGDEDNIVILVDFSNVWIFCYILKLYKMFLKIVFFFLDIFYLFLMNLIFDIVELILELVCNGIIL